MKFNIISLPHIQNIIAVASGKGGVGKSTIAFNLAVGMAQRGLKIGLLDADIYGPSVPLLTGQNRKPEIKDNKFIPLKAYGVHIISMGFLVEEHMPVMWRGPMLQTAIKQFFKDVSWPELDLLIVDMPPGTGDAHLTIAQSVPLRGTVLVSTPQDLSLIDAIRCLKTFQTLKVPILGMIENMAGLECPHCHNSIAVFKKETLLGICQKEKVPYLGSIPLDPDLVRRSDEGQPSTLDQGSSVYKNYTHLLDNLLKTPHLQEFLPSTSN